MIYFFKAFQSRFAWIIIKIIIFWVSSFCHNLYYVRLSNYTLYIMLRYTLCHTLHLNWWYTFFTLYFTLPYVIRYVTSYLPYTLRYILRYTDFMLQNFYFWVATLKKNIDVDSSRLGSIRMQVNWNKTNRQEYIVVRLLYMTWNNVSLS